MPNFLTKQLPVAETFKAWIQALVAPKVNKIATSVYTGDMNDLLSGGDYFCSPGVTNAPAGNTQPGFVKVYEGPAGRITQIWNGFYTSGSFVLQRDRAHDTLIWNNWAPVLPTASDTTKGGVKIGDGLTMAGEFLQVTTGSGVSYPDWSTGVDISYPWVATSDGWIVCAFKSYDYSYQRLYINGVKIYQCGGTNYDGRGCLEMPVKVGDNITKSGSGFKTFTFYYNR